MRNLNRIGSGIVFVLVVILAIGCASTPPLPQTEKMEELDSKLNVNTPEKEKVGIRGQQIVLQKKVYLEEQLWKWEAEVDRLQKTIYGNSRSEPGGMWEALKTCRKRLSDKRLGGSGVPDGMEDWVKISDQELEYNYSIDKNGNIIGLSEEELGVRLSRYRKYKVALEQKYNEFQNKTEGCEAKYRAVLVDHGMDPADTEARGEWADGPDGYKIWKLRRPTSFNPEELQRRKAQKE